MFHVQIVHGVRGRVSHGIGVLFFGFIALSSSVHAADLKFSNLQLTELNRVFDEFGANFAPALVTPASHEGFLHFEFGPIFGITKTPGIDGLVPTEDIAMIPHGGFYLGVDAPFGLAGEILALPLKVQGLDMSHYQIAAKWTINKVFLGDILPFDAMVRAMFLTTKVDYSYTDTATAGSPTVDVTYENQSTSLNLTLSRKFLFVEPFIGFGYLKGSSDLKATGTTTFFSSDIPLGSREDVDTSDSYPFFGIQFNIFFVKLAAEYMNIFDTDRYTAKLSFNLGI